MKIIFVLQSPVLTGQGKAIVVLCNKLRERGYQTTLVALRALPIGWAPLPEKISVLGESALVQAIARSDVAVATHRIHARKVWEAAQSVGVSSLYLYDEPELRFQKIQGVLSEKERAVLGLIEKELVNCLKLPWSVITPGHHAAEHVWKLARKQAIVIPQGIDHQLFTPNVEGSSRKAKTILLVGPLRSLYKGIRMGYQAYLKLIRRHPSVRLIRVSQERENLRLPNTRFFYNPSPSRLARIYRSADVLWWTSYAEVFPLPPLEAMACGTPVITSRFPAIFVEYAQEEKNCLAYTLGDIEGLVFQTERLFSNFPLRNSLVTSGLATARRFSWESVAHRFEKVFEKLQRTGRKEDKVSEILSELRPKVSRAPLACAAT